MLASGKGGITNPQAAVHLFRKAAQQGEATAQYNLGNMLFDGRGSAKDVFEATLWYRKAADQGYARAQFAYAVALSEARRGRCVSILQACSATGTAGGAVQSWVYAG